MNQETRDSVMREHRRNLLELEEGSVTLLRRSNQYLLIPIKIVYTVMFIRTLL